MNQGADGARSIAGRPTPILILPHKGGGDRNRNNIDLSEMP